MSMTHSFAGNPLNRGDAERRDPAWLAEAQRSDAARFLPLWQLNVLLRQNEGGGVSLGWIQRRVAARLDLPLPPVFLGLQNGTPCFGLDLSDLGDPLHELGLGDGWDFQDCRAAAMALDIPETGILAQARAQLDWHRRHPFCSVCGAASVAERGGSLRRCPACGAAHFPRTDPVVIMLIGHGDRCLLGQSAGRLAGSGMYSALAGFVEQGESIEEAVRREVREEAGIEVGEVRYHSSQPWPFPSSLMIGCLGAARSSGITIDVREMADVQWFHHDDVRQALEQSHPRLRVPGPLAIAHHLIRAWLQEVQPS
ncbi:MAG: NAD(+) diphosphatase [Pseudomonadales bacterium]